jgi:hypothetical protein
MLEEHLLKLHQSSSECKAKGAGKKRSKKKVFLFELQNMLSFSF